MRSLNRRSLGQTVGSDRIAGSVATSHADAMATPRWSALSGLAKWTGTVHAIWDNCPLLLSRLSRPDEDDVAQPLRVHDAGLARASRAETCDGRPFDAGDPENAGRRSRVTYASLGPAARRRRERGSVR